MKTKILAALLAATALAFAGGCIAQGNFPAHTITLVVGFAPGGATDTSARIIAKKLGENLGQAVVVDNRPGAGGNIAHQQVANAAPDGYTILMGSIGPLAIAPHLVAKLPYDPQKDLAPLTMGVVFPNVLVVHAGVAAKTLAEYVALAKQKPGELNYASTGIGSAAHLAGELFNARAGVDIAHIPYKGGGPAMTDLLGGRITSYYATPSTAAPYLESGKLRALASTGPARSPTLPNVPTVAESGYPGFEATNWYAFVAPGKTPVDLLDRWNRELVKVLKSPDVREQLLQHGLEPMPGTREDLANYMRKESETWGKVIRAAKITAE